MESKVENAVTTNRLLSIVNKPKLPESVEVTQLNGSESINDGFEFKIDIIALQLLEDALQLYDSITIKLHHHASQPRYLNGIIHAIAFNGYHDNHYHYTINLQSWLQILQHETDCRIFQHKSVLEIINLICQPHHFPAINIQALNKTYPKIAYCTQYNESSYAFIQRILAQYKINFLFTHNVTQHELLLFDSINFSGKKSINICDPIVMTHPMQTHTEVTSQVYSSNNYDYLHSKLNLHSTSNIPTSQHNHLSKPLEHYHFPGNHTQLAQGQSDVNDKAEAAKQHSYSIKYTTTAAINLNQLIENTDNSSQDNFRIVKIIHSAQQSSTHKNTPNKNNNYYQATLHCINSSIVLKPKSINKQLMLNSQVAVVAGPDDKAVYTDAQGRIKVRFYWDRSNSNNSTSSSWLRVSQALAGDGWGTRFTPLVGTEVWVDFINNDPDQPIVTRQAYNRLNTPPYAPTESYYSGIKSPNLEPGQPSNEIRFSDQAKHEHVYLNAQRDLIQQANNNIVFNIKNSENHTIQKGNQETHVDNGNYCLAAKNIKFKTGENEIIMNKDEIIIKGDLIKIN